MVLGGGQRSYAANVALALELVSAGADEVPDELPPESVAFARASARAGLSADAIATVFRTGQSRFWEGWRERIDALGFPAETTLAVLDEVMTFGSRYLAWSAQEIARRYQLELESSADTVLALVRQVLDGRAAQDVQLGYGLHGRHLALVAAGPRAREAAAACAAELGRRPLVVSPDPDTAWAWLSEQPEPDARRRRPLAELAAASGVVIGVGAGRSGIQGFRRSHEEARIALRCAQAAGERLAVYADVLPEALALGDAGRGGRACRPHARPAGRRPARPPAEGDPPRLLRDRQRRQRRVAARRQQAHADLPDRRDRAAARHADLRPPHRDRPGASSRAARRRGRRRAASVLRVERRDRRSGGGRGVELPPAARTAVGRPSAAGRPQRIAGIVMRAFSTAHVSASSATISQPGAPIVKCGRSGYSL